jgi:hypothetical protein
MTQAPAALARGILAFVLSNSGSENASTHVRSVSHAEMTSLVSIDAGASAS